MAKAKAKDPVGTTVTHEYLSAGAWLKFSATYITPERAEEVARKLRLVANVRNVVVS